MSKSNHKEMCMTVRTISIIDEEPYTPTIADKIIEALITSAIVIAVLAFGFIGSGKAFSADLWQKDVNLVQGDLTIQYESISDIDYQHIEAGYNLFENGAGTVWAFHLRTAETDYFDFSITENRGSLTVAPSWIVGPGTLMYEHSFQYLSIETVKDYWRYRGLAKYSMDVGHFTPYVSVRASYSEHVNYEGTEWELGTSWQLDKRFSVGAFYRETKDDNWHSRYNMIGTEITYEIP